MLFLQNSTLYFCGGKTNARMSVAIRFDLSRRFARTILAKRPPTCAARWMTCVGLYFSNMAAVDSGSHKFASCEDGSRIARRFVSRLEPLRVASDVRTRAHGEFSFFFRFVVHSSRERRSNVRSLFNFVWLTRDALARSRPSLAPCSRRRSTPHRSVFRPRSPLGSRSRPGRFHR